MNTLYDIISFPSFVTIVLSLALWLKKKRKIKFFSLQADKYSKVANLACIIGMTGSLLLWLMGWNAIYGQLVFISGIFIHTLGVYASLRRRAREIK